MNYYSAQQLEHMDRLISQYRAWLEKAMLSEPDKDPYAHHSRLREVRWQHLAMAGGHHGGSTGNEDGSTIRETYYKGYSNSFFKMICERMGWREC